MASLGTLIFYRLFLPAAALLLAPIMAVPLAAQDVGAKQEFDAEVAKVATLNTASDPKGAIEHIDFLLAQADELGGTPTQRADLIRKRGLALVNLYEFEEAIVWLEKAIDAYRLTPDEVRLEVTGQLRNNIGHAYSALKQWDSAIATFNDNLPFLEETYGRETREYAGALFGLAATHYRSGNWSKAIELTRQAADLERAVDRRADANDHSPDTVTVVTSLGTMLNRYGLVEEAMVYSREAADYALDRFGPEDQMSVLALSNLARQLTAAGRLREAEDITQRVLSQRIKLLGEDHPLVARTLQSLGEIKLGLGYREEGRFLLQEAQARFAVNPDESSPATNGAIAVRLALLDDNMEARKNALDAAIEILLVSVPAEHPEIASARVRAAEAAWAQGDRSAVATYLALARPVLQAELSPDHPDRISAIMLESALEHQPGKPVSPLAIGALDQIRDALLDDAVAPAERVADLDRYLGPLAIYAQMSSDSGNLAGTFMALQLMQLTELDSASRAQSVAAGLPEDRAARLFAIRDAITEARLAQGELAAAQSVGEPVGERTAQKFLENRQATLASLYSQLAIADPQSLTAIRPDPVPLTIVQQQLAGGEAVLLAVPSDQAVLTLAVTADGAYFTRRDAARSAVGDLVKTIRNSLDPGSIGNQSFDLRAARRMAGLVLHDDLLSFLGDTNRLHARLGGDLAQLPLSVLPLADGPDRPDPDIDLAQIEWAVTRFAISSPLDLGHIDRSGTRSSGTRFAGIGAPQLTGSLELEDAVTQLMRGGAVRAGDLRAMPALPGAADELKNLAELFGSQNSRLLVGEDANEQAVKSFDFAPYSVLVFATHALVAGELNAVAEPGLVLTPPAESAGTEDGFLSASEISLLDVNADWVILSGCNTAAGGSRGEPALTGLARAFVDAGAGSLMVSHWRVRDDAAAFLSMTAVEGVIISGQSRAEALRGAQLAMIDGTSGVANSSHPAVWAPFVIIEP